MKTELRHAPVSWRAVGASAAVLVGAGVYALARQDELPARIPMHYDVHGVPDRFAARSSVTLLMPLLISAVALLVTVGASAAARNSSSPAMVAYTRRVLWVVTLGVAIVGAAVALAPYFGVRPVLVAAATLALASAIVAFRARPRATGSESTDGWRGGVIYYKKADANILVPKRWGLGYTLNFARPMAWLVLALMLISPVLVILLVA